MIHDLIKKYAPEYRWYDILETSGVSTPLVFKNNAFHSINEKHNRGIGLRININGKTGFSYTNDLNGIEETVKRAVELSAFGDTETFDLLLQDTPDIEPYDETIDSFSIETEMSKVQNAISYIEKEVPHTQVDVSISRSKNNISLENSKGFSGSFNASSYSASISATHIFEDGSKIDVWESLSELSVSSIDGAVAKLITKLKNGLRTSKLSSGKHKILLTPKAASNLLSILGSGLNARAVYKGISPFTKELGKKSFNNNLTLIDNPLEIGSPFSFPFDDEGIAGKSKRLIDEGRITGFITDLKHASLLSIEPTGNGQRSFASLPSPSFSTIIIEPGKDSLESLYDMVGTGILIDGFIGLGQSNTLTGDFSATIDPAYLIKNGEVQGRLKDCMVSDNLFRLLKEDIVLSSEREKRGSVILPYICIPDVHYTG